MTAAGFEVRVVTVLAGDTASSTPAGWWDTAAGFPTLGEAARARRIEDRRALAHLGASPVWLSFNDAQYERGATDDEIVDAVADAVVDAESVLVPGFPLVHVDHKWLFHLIIRRGLSNARLGLYVEQPYAWRAWQHERLSIRAPESSEQMRTRDVAWDRERGRPSSWRAKLRACHEYRSQTPMFGRLPFPRLVLHELAHGGEAVAWLED
jgi:hypothetical protein